MDNFQYIMVTDWEGHWDVKWKNSTPYTRSYINLTPLPAIWPAEVPTLFIKRSKGGFFEKSWLGKSKGFRADNYKGKPAIRFEISDLVTTECPEGYKLYSSGWWAREPNGFVPGNQSIAEKASILEPPFFKDLASTTDWKSFEQYCFLLLKLLGIHNIERYLSSDNRGKGDGIFIFNNLVVIYDATLLDDFEKAKKEQINNFIHQLKESKIEISNSWHTIQPFNKQVWIITKGAEVRPLYKEDGVQVKEIPYTRLIALFRQRLQMDIGSEKLHDILKDLE